MANKDFLYGLSKMTFAGKTVGYIEKDSFEWGGKAPESVDVDAEQVPDAPVLTLVQKNSTVEPKFNMIQLNYENMAALLGGKSTATGWEAPTDLLQLSGECLIDTPSGKRIKIPNAVLLSNLGGKLTLTEVSKIECQLKVMKPADGTAPFSIIDIPAG
ncbi:hypothetical protein KZO77_12355 [Prevotella melaninogenica]|uniref:Phage tail protein n=1 Tax=Prevotella melaninogenica TaxID=28132 RepID=A0ABS6Y9E0_9BACT|nr:hypothetical protein [Prevotella melaninogenica]MBW4755799.1 hypothetical protein [Prevotella melaninogenica]